MSVSDVEAKANRDQEHTNQEAFERLYRDLDLATIFSDGQQ